VQDQKSWDIPASPHARHIQPTLLSTGRSVRQALQDSDVAELRSVQTRQDHSSFSTVFDDKESRLGLLFGRAGAGAVIAEVLGRDVGAPDGPAVEAGLFRTGLGASPVRSISALLSMLSFAAFSASSLAISP
jgi:hypothetical protein